MKKKSNIPGIVIVVCLLLGGYVGSYILFSEKQDVSRFYNVERRSWRYCDQSWMVTAFTPLAAIEGFLTGEEIIVVDDDSW